MSTALKIALDDMSFRMAQCGASRLTRRRAGLLDLSSRDSAVAELEKQLYLATEALDLEC